MDLSVGRYYIQRQREILYVCVCVYVCMYICVYVCVYVCACESEDKERDQESIIPPTTTAQIPEPVSLLLPLVLSTSSFTRASQSF